MYVYAPHCVPGTYGGQKKPLDALKVKLQRVVSHHTDTGSRTKVKKEHTATSTVPTYMILNES